MGSFVISLSKPLVFFHMHFKGGKKVFFQKFILPIFGCY